MSQAQFPVLVSQGQGQRQCLGRPVVVRRDAIDSLFNEEEFSIDLDNEAVLKKKQPRSEAFDRVAEFCNLDRQDPQIQKEVTRLEFGDRQLANAGQKYLLTCHPASGRQETAGQPISCQSPKLQLILVHIYRLRLNLLQNQRRSFHFHYGSHVCKQNAHGAV